ncbi:MAG: IPT/TIG domain-containing protein [Cyanobacteria bacterium NC_groundwater_1444_Ag_S-0.65um_54_12]|nr:IPT/TIG domain-containing protein [Cyanobacteria bacterium NC_groundwater_1444_Ag_S-0.65um_54_12]
MILLLPLVACRPAVLLSQTTRNFQQIPPLAGWLSPQKRFHLQLVNLREEFAKGATVSLIEVASGNTVATSLADANGQFLIQFGAAFTPYRTSPADRRSVAYYLEAVKGIAGRNPMPNQSGAVALRLRTLIWFDFDDNGWICLANASPGALTISLSTTTVAFYLNDRVVKQQAIRSEDYIGCLDASLADSAPADYTPAGDLSATLYAELYQKVVAAVIDDQDPIHALVISPDNTVINAQTSFALAGISPAGAAIGSTVTINGLNLVPNAMQVTFAGNVIATSDPGSSSVNALVLTVPPGARTGLVQVSLNGISAYTPFSVTTSDGHLATFTDAGGATALYTVSSAIGTLVKVRQDGSTVTLNSGTLTNPSGVLVNPERSATSPFKIYVADTGNNRIVQFDDTGTVLNANFLAVTNPTALALGPDGDLYVAQTATAAILRARIDWTAGTVSNPGVATYTGIAGPAALAFDHGGFLYAVLPTSGQVQRFRPGTADSGSIVASPESWAIINDPRGIAIDTAGNCLVTSTDNNVIFRIDPFRNMSVLAGMASPRAIAGDPAGNLYVVDSQRSLVRIISPSGDQRVLAYGLASSRGVAVDGSGNVYVSLQNSNAIIKLASDGITTTPLLTGMAPPSGLTFRGGSLYVAHTDTHSVTRVGLDGSAAAAITSGLFFPGGVDVSDDGATYYVGRFNTYPLIPYEYFPPTGGWYPIVGESGINIVAGATNTHRKPLLWGRRDGAFFESGARISSTAILFVSRRLRKLLLITQFPGNPGSHLISDVTPSFGGTKLFPDEVYDLAYDGSRYAYVSCRDKNVYRIDTTNYTLDPGVIGGIPGTPWGLAVLAGALYAVDYDNNRIYRSLAPPTTTNWDGGSYGPFGSRLMGIVGYGAKLYVTDYSGTKIWQYDPAVPGVSVYLSSLVSGPSRIAAFSDGRLLVETSGQYVISTANPPVPSLYSQDNDGVNFFIDGANGVFRASSYVGSYFVANGIANTREVCRDGNWVYVAAYDNVYGYHLATGDELSIRGMGRPTGLAANPGTNEVYVLNQNGGLYSFDLASRTVTSRGSLSSGAGWGLDYDATGNKLYAASPTDGLIYRIDPATGWSSTALKVGLNGTRF